MKGILLLFILLTFVSNAQEELSSTHPFYFGNWDGHFYPGQEGDKAYVFADACNVRKEPKTDAALVGKLYIGTSVKILEQTDIELTLNGVESTWLKVKSDTIVGYVWGGTLTNEVLKLPNKRVAVWGVTKYVETDTSRHTTISVRIAQNKSVISSVDFYPEYASNPKYGELMLHAKPLLDSVTMYLSFHTMIESCGATGSNTYIFEMGGALKCIGFGHVSGEANYHESRDLLFPVSEEDVSFEDHYYTPQRNRVLILTIDRYPDDDCIIKEERTIEEFEWKNNELYKYCEE